MRVNINQIAALAQVSKGTVSKALNGQKGVGDETRQRILSLVEALEYQPDSTGRALARKQTGSIGLLIPHEGIASFMGLYWPMVLAGVAKRASELQLNLMLLTLPKEGDTTQAARQILGKKLVDGLIIGGDILDSEFFARLVRSGMNFVLVGQNPDIRHACVDVDNTLCTDRIMRHILSRGYQRVGAIFGPLEFPYSKDRREGYRTALHRAGLTWTAETSSRYLSGETTAALSQMLDDHPDMDALFVAAGGHFLLDCLEVLRGRGITIPQFGLGAFDDYPFLNFISPKVTAVRQPGEALGMRAVDLLTDVIEGRALADTVLRLDGSLIVRESCGEATDRPDGSPPQIL